MNETFMILEFSQKHNFFDQILILILIQFSDFTSIFSNSVHKSLDVITYARELLHLEGLFSRKVKKLKNSQKIENLTRAITFIVEIIGRI